MVSTLQQQQHTHTGVNEIKHQIAQADDIARAKSFYEMRGKSRIDESENSINEIKTLIVFVD